MLHSVEKSVLEVAPKRQHRTGGPESERLFAPLAALDHQILPLQIARCAADDFCAQLIRMAPR
jgi:hypothetical protein